MGSPPHSPRRLFTMHWAAENRLLTNQTKHSPGSPRQPQSAPSLFSSGLLIHCTSSQSRIENSAAPLRH
uniref:Uncharacterized protein n=1 Tax=Knipowitschia caucasica TaxID=637954 RepID=A0AAV2JHY1_KNICA